MPSRIARSLSMQSTIVPSSRPTLSRGGPRSFGAAALLSARGTSIEKREPRPRVDFSATSQSSTRAMRSTIERPKPTPRATRAP